MTKDKVERFPVPDGLLERFMGIIWSMVEPFGIDKIPEVMHHVELLGQAIDRQVSDSSSGLTDRRVALERRKFVTIFKHRFLHNIDFEYNHPVTPAEGKLMGQVIDMIGGKGFGVDEFLQWVFEIFLEENPKFNPPSIKFVCSHFVVDKFLFDNREVMKQKQQDDVRAQAALDVVGKARTLMRIAKDEGRQQDADFVINLLKKYRDGCIMLGELKIEVERIEAGKQAEGGESHGV